MSGQIELSFEEKNKSLIFLIEKTVPTANIAGQAKADFLENELSIEKMRRQEFDQIAIQRAAILIEAHERFRRVIGGKQYQGIKPVLPMDLMGIYILLSDNSKDENKNRGADDSRKEN